MSESPEVPPWLVPGVLVTLPKLDIDPSRRGRRYRVVRTYTSRTMNSKTAVSLQRAEPPLYKGPKVVDLGHVRFAGATAPPKPQTTAPLARPPVSRPPAAEDERVVHSFVFGPYRVIVTEIGYPRGATLRTEEHTRPDPEPVPVL